MNIEPVIDRDTAGIPGAPDIARAILQKIDECAIFVGVFPSSAQPRARTTPNPNVLVELGYAFKAKGGNRLILIQNTAYGSPESLPFDLRMKRITTYALPPENADKATERNALAKKLEEAIRAVLPEIEALAKAASTDELLEIIHDPAKRTQVHRLIMDSANEFRAKLDTASPEELVTNFSDQVFRQRVKDFEGVCRPFRENVCSCGTMGRAPS